MLNCGTVVSKKYHYNPLISKGYVSLSENGGKVPVKILRDTGATQPLLVEGIFSLSDSTATGTSVKIHGIELGVDCATTCHLPQF